MRCVCGYSHDEPPSEDEPKELLVPGPAFMLGDEPFTEIEGTFLIREDYSVRQVSLYACPNCGTVQMSRY